MLQIFSLLKRDRRAIRYRYVVGRTSLAMATG